MQNRKPYSGIILRWLAHPALPVLIFLLFLGIASTLKFGIDQQNDAQISSRLQSEAKSLARELERDFTRHVEALKRMAERRKVLPAISEAQWREDARNYLTDFETYQAIEWISRDFLVRWVEPFTGNEDVLGFNVAFSDARHEALDRAILTGSLDVSGVIQLKQGGTGLVIYAPIGASDRNNGFIAGVFRMENLLEALQAPRIRNHFQLDIMESGQSAYQLNADSALITNFSEQVPVNLPAVEWALKLSPTKLWATQHRSFWPWVTFVTMVAVGAMVSVSVLLVQLILKRNQVLLKTRSELEQEVDQRKAIQQDLARLASTDALTGLANRRFFMEDLAHTLSIADRQLRQVALVMIDLDRFQMLNDSLGHQFGDELLIKVSERLNQLSDERVLVAYSGGDEFMICQQQVEDIDDVINLLGHVKQCFSKPFIVQNEAHTITATMGVAVYPQSGLDADILLRNADIALYRAKDSGRNTYQFYTEGMQDREVMRLELDKDLNNALARDEFVLYYQPQLDLATMQMGSVEALIRWQHPERGLLPPIEFIPLAEESGRITDIGRWVVLAACRQLAEWSDGPLSHLRVAVNLSGRELDDKGLVEHIQQALAKHGVPADRLEVELTEEIFIANLERNLDQLTRLNKLGVHLAIDDFGVGYSSLAYLRDFPVDLLKIDRSFITNVTDRHDDAVITRAVINLAHNLGIQVAAEGIETEAQLNFLKSHRCDLAQGYLISRPIPAADLPALLARGIKFDSLPTAP
ncbi:putative bifunctional diguanylate cyclase/phosphodiesterase [Marinobacter caseinilyticus]|uniref:putative bifunctional diguanylate cyclase/phosphodiesterase n=1 Tax=Marinobacter caseinilyticus TaxID=2692195 RepID=UPI001F311624|nr:EAL domain-containing protein [Marinobacter caseinilyticus]